MEQESWDRDLLAGSPNQGLVQVYTGNGKGKTTAALGLAIRAAGHGLKVHIVHFMKTGGEYGEFKELREHPNISFRVFGPSYFVSPDNVPEEARQMVAAAFAHARGAAMSDEYDILILDEINIALAWQILALEPVLEMIRTRPRRLELVLTGRYAPDEILAVADLVSEVREVKHPYGQGIPCRQGIEF